MTSELRKFFGAPTDAGLLVQHVEPGSAAEVAKVQVGDVLVEVDGQRIEKVSDVRDALADRSKGDVVDVVVVRNKKRKTLEATLASEPGPVAFSIPHVHEHGMRLPPEARRFMSPGAQQQLERELERAREQLREVERRLEALEVEPPAAAPEPPEPPGPLPAPKRGRGRSPGKRTR
jgi:membrane-associated protease RseP (regulator of RpoE activity)